MKKLVAVLCVLALVAMFLPVKAQDVDVQIRVKQRPQPTAMKIGYIQEPRPVVFTGSGCYGSRAVPTGGGCISRSGGGCISTRMGSGCYGSRPAMGYMEAPVIYQDEAPIFYGGPLIIAAGPRPFAYGVDGKPLVRGEPRGDGKYATESGKPLPPGIVPWNGPFVGAWRASAGYNRTR